MIQAQQLVKHYGGQPVLRGVDLNIAPGEFVAIMGESGSGKTSLLNLLAGLDRADGGQLQVAGVELVGRSKDQLVTFRREHLAMIFQDFHLLAGLTALENLTLPLRLSGRPADKDRLKALLDRVGLAGKAGQLPQKLSGGEQQRVAIARALALQPKILLADEPTGNLDRKNSEAIMALLKELQQAEGMTLVMVTHSRQAGAVADRIVTMEDGCLL
ncbi:MAG: ABC transporter ATP-binding protein [bacterium]|nr:ABC transporter ATP-binding protein [bacterium]